MSLENGRFQGLLSPEEIDLLKQGPVEDISHIPPGDVVSVYFRQMSSEPLLSAEEEVKLAKWMEEGKQALKHLSNGPLTEEEREKYEVSVELGVLARDRLGRSNTRLVASIAKKHRNRGLPMSELIQEGNLGLMTAVDKFDYRRGNRFSTYATWWIRQTIGRAISQKSRTIRLPTYVADVAWKVYQEVERLKKEEEWFDEESIALSLRERGESVTARTVKDILLMGNLVELDKEAGDGGEMGDFIEDREADVVHKVEGNLFNKAAVIEVKKILLAEKDGERLWRVLKLRFGIVEEDDVQDEGRFPGETMTLEEVAVVFDLSRERIRQLEAHALRLLKKGLRGSGLAEQLD